MVANLYIYSPSMSDDLLVCVQPGEFKSTFEGMSVTAAAQKHTKIYCLQEDVMSLRLVCCLD